MADQKSVYEEIFASIKSKLDDPKIIYTLHDKFEDFPTLASDVESIDQALDGGLPSGKIIEIFGPEAGGKTTTALHFIAAAQKRGSIVYFIDAEHALDPQYAGRIGIDFSKLMFSQPDTGEQALETIRIICESTEEIKLKRSRDFDTLIVVDSVPALIPKEIFTIYEKDGLESSNALGAAARMFASKLPMIVNKASKAGVTIAFINQVRDKIGVTWGATTTTPGGRAMKFFASLRIKVNRIGYYERAGERAGIRVQMIPVKSKQFPIFNRVADFIIGPNGIDAFASLIEVAIKKKVVIKKGAWYTFGDTRCQGQVNFEDELKKIPGITDKLREALKAVGGQTTQIELKPVAKPAPAPAPAVPPQPLSAAKNIRTIGQ